MQAWEFRPAEDKLGGALVLELGGHTRKADAFEVYLPLDQLSNIVSNICPWGGVCAWLTNPIAIYIL